MPSPRAHLQARLDGVVPELLLALRATKTPNEDTLLKLTKLNELLREDLDSALDFHSSGGIQVLTSLLTASLASNSEECGDAAGAVLQTAASRVPVGWKAVTSDPMPSPLNFNFSSFLRAPPVDWEALRPGSPPPSESPALSKEEEEEEETCAAAAAAAAAAAPSILLRRVTPEEKRQSSQEDVGFLLWPACLPFSRWLVAHREALFPAASSGAPPVRVLELGSGCGLCGITAGLFSHPRFQRREATTSISRTSTCRASVALTDFNPTVLSNLSVNAALNEPRLHVGDATQGALGDLAGASGGEGGDTSLSGPLFTVDALDWCQQQQDQHLPPYDLVLGCDIVCSEGDAVSVAKVCRERLGAGGGTALLCHPPGDVRWGVGAIIPALQAQGLRVCHELPMHPQFLRASLGEEEEGGVEMAESTCVAPGYESRLKILVIRTESKI